MIGRFMEKCCFIAFFSVCPLSYPSALPYIVRSGIGILLMSLTEIFGNHIQNADKTDIHWKQWCRMNSYEGEDVILVIVGIFAAAWIGRFLHVFLLFML